MFFFFFAKRKKKLLGQYTKSLTSVQLPPSSPTISQPPNSSHHQTPDLRTPNPNLCLHPRPTTSAPEPTKPPPSTYNHRPLPPPPPRLCPQTLTLASANEPRLTKPSLIDKPPIQANELQANDLRNKPDCPRIIDPQPLSFSTNCQPPKPIPTNPKSTNP